MASAARMPVAFVTDFGPMPAVETDDYTAALGRLGRELPRPRAAIVMSGHWEAGEILGLTAAEAPEILYDYYGFPESYYQVHYPCAGSPAVAAEAASLLEKSGFQAALDPARGLDHGVWAPMSRVFPAADVPIVQIAVPSRWTPRRIMDLGRALAPLRDRGILLTAAGALIHNLRLVRFGSAEVDAWAAAFDEWIGARLDAGDREALLGYETLAPSARLSVPTPEHFVPLFFALGAAADEKPRHYYREIRHGNGLLRAMAFGGR